MAVVSGTEQCSRLHPSQVSSCSWAIWIRGREEPERPAVRRREQTERAVQWLVE